MKFLITSLAFFATLGCSTGFRPFLTKTESPSQQQLSQESIWNLPSKVLNPKALPLGNGKFMTTGPRAGYVYACDARMYTFTQIIGGRVTGPWVNEANNTFDPTTKVADGGSVVQAGKFNVTIAGGNRSITGNGLPVDQPTGIFPVSSSDAAYQYDQNPNAITAQNISFSLPQNPVVADTPYCTYKRIGITLDGVELEVPLDTSGRDENGYELADSCGGKSQPGGSYHRQYLSDCVPHIRENNALVGYALDGFGIFSPFDVDGHEITSAQLDECHGLTSEIEWDGQRVNMYHYVMTRDFPYTITCFRGAPNYDAFPALPPPPGQSGPAPQSPSPAPASPAPALSNIDSSCSAFAPDNSAQALSHIRSEIASQCQNDLNMLTQLYSQLVGKTCDQIKQILASAPPGPNGQPMPPPPAPNGTLYNALVNCAAGGSSGSGSPAPQPPPNAPPPPHSPVIGVGGLYAGQQLLPGQIVVSNDSRYNLIYQTDGNVVLYGPGGAVVWATYTVGYPLGVLIMQGDGNLVLYSGYGQPVWSSGTYGNPGSFLFVQTDSNLVVYSANSTPLWSIYTGLIYQAPAYDPNGNTGENASSGGGGPE